MKKHFNITGQCDPDVHYMVNLDSRLKEIRVLIEQGAFFSINKGRQYGKTTMLHALIQFLQSDFIVVSLDFQFLGTESFKNEFTFVSDFSDQLYDELYGVSGLDMKLIDEMKENANNKDCNLAKLFKYLSMLCATAAKPLVLLIDEVDSASNNQVFLDFLAVLRGYYIHRKKKPIFQSVILAGVYDIKNLKGKICPDTEHKINSPWNIATEFNVTLEFSQADIAGMLQEYDYDYKTGMDINAVAGMIYDYTSGYPLLVSKLCKIIDGKSADRYKDRTAAWTKEGILEAVNIVLTESNPLFDSLLRQLREYPELKEILHTILFSGNSVGFNPYHFVIDLASMFGFIKNANGTVVIANRIFETLLYNYFTSVEELNNKIYRVGSSDRNLFVSNGVLDMDLVMERFAVEFNHLYHNEDDRFIEENCRKFFLLFIKPIINGTGNYYVEARTRDNRRTDIIVNYHGAEYVIEVKIWRGEEYNKRGEQQLADYLDLYEAKKGWLLSFNFNKNKIPGIKEIQCRDKSLVEIVV